MKELELNINTDAGNLQLAPATLDELKSVALHWPMGMVFRQEENEPSGLVFQVGEQEAYGLKFQPPDNDEQNARALFFNNQALIASALPFYLKHQHQGIMVPCTYFKEKTDGRIESGFAFFVSPDPASKPATGSKVGDLHDDKLGDGASKMIFDFMDAISKASKRVELPFGSVIGIDLRPRLALGTLGMIFLVQGAKVFVIQHPLRSDNPVWAFALRAGFSNFRYAPMITAAVPGPQNAPHAWLDRLKFLSQRLWGKQS